MYQFSKHSLVYLYAQRPPINSLEDILLSVCVKPFGQLGQRLATMRNLVLLNLGHLGICLALVLETGIPSCSSNQFLFGSLSKRQAYQSRWDRGPRQSYPVVPVSTLLISGVGIAKSNLGSSLKNDGFVARTLRVRKCAYCLGTLVFKSCKKFVELLNAERLHEPFAVKRKILVCRHKGSSCEDSYTYGPGSSSQASKHKHVSSTSTGPPT